jgi:site-specific recombinase XerD
MPVHLDKAKGLWRARVTLPGTDGNTRHLGWYKTKSEAQRATKAAQTDLARGTWIDPRESHIALETFWEAYTASTRYQRKTQGSKDVDRATWNKYIGPTFGGRRLDKIRHSDVQDWIDGLIAAGASRSTVNRCHRTLRAILNRAVAEERIPRNPAIGCDVPAVPMKRDADELAEVVWDVPELQAIIRAHPDRYRAFVALIATAGLRESEAIGLRWPNVDVLAFEVHVVEAVTLTSIGLVRGPTKNKHRRTVSITTGVAAMLVEHRESFGEGPDGAVFTNKHGRLINRVNFLRAVFRPALKSEGVHDGDVHSLRHSAGSILAAELGIEEARNLLGHGHSSTTERYVHALKAKRERSRQALETLWANDATGFGPILAPDSSETLQDNSLL